LLHNIIKYYDVLSGLLNVTGKSVSTSPHIQLPDDVFKDVEEVLFLQKDLEEGNMVLCGFFSIRKQHL